jgi:hypothetical protein
MKHTIYIVIPISYYFLPAKVKYSPQGVRISSTSTWNLFGINAYN